MPIINSYLRRFDWILFGISLLLVCFGLAALYSLTLNAAKPNFLNLDKQLIFTGLGLLFLFLMSFIDYHWLKSYAWVIYIIGFILLALVLVTGVSFQGTTGWFSILGQYFQPVEISKLILIIFLARYFSKHWHEFNHLKLIIVSGFYTLIFFLLVAGQPDFGSALILVAIWLAMISGLKIKPKHLLVLAVLVVIVSLVSWGFIFNDIQKSRVLVYLNPSRDPLGRGYNLTQSIIAVGSGQLFGRGLGLGPQSQLNFLPAQQTDFIFAVIAEELGFLGALILLGLFGILAYRIVRLLQDSRDDFGSFLTLGILALIFIQMFVNIGMNLGLVPVAGIPLPFISAGGSSLVTNLIAIGILESIFIRHRLATFL